MGLNKVPKGKGVARVSSSDTVTGPLLVLNYQDMLKALTQCHQQALRHAGAFEHASKSNDKKAVKWSSSESSKTTGQIDVYVKQNSLAALIEKGSDNFENICKQEVLKPEVVRTLIPYLIERLKAPNNWAVIDRCLFAVRALLMHPNIALTETGDLDKRDAVNHLSVILMYMGPAIDYLTILPKIFPKKKLNRNDYDKNELAIILESIKLLPGNQTLESVSLDDFITALVNRSMLWLNNLSTTIVRSNEQSYDASPYGLLSDKIHKRKAHNAYEKFQEAKTEKGLLNKYGGYIKQLSAEQQADVQSFRLNELSQKNLEQLKAKFNHFATEVNPALGGRLIKLRDRLMALNWTASHATNAYAAIQSAGKLGSTLEMERAFIGHTVSDFSSARNWDNFGNKDFVFFRVTPTSKVMSETRYGNTTISVNIRDLIGRDIDYTPWLSLHDQAQPFSNESSKIYKNKSGDAARIITSDSNAQSWGVEYPLTGSHRKVNFTEEIFVGAGELIEGIVYTICNELIYCGEDNLENICLLAESLEDEEFVDFAVNLTKSFVRPELKLPVSLDLRKVPHMVTNPVGLGIFDMKTGARNEVAWSIYTDVKEKERALRAITSPYTKDSIALYIKTFIELSALYQKLLDNIPNVIEDTNDPQQRQSVLDAEKRIVSNLRSMVDNFLSGCAPDKDQSAALNQAVHSIKIHSDFTKKSNTVDRNKN